MRASRPTTADAGPWMMLARARHLHRLPATSTPSWRSPTSLQPPSALDVRGLDLQKIPHPSPSTVVDRPPPVVQVNPPVDPNTDVIVPTDGTYTGCMGDCSGVGVSPVVTAGPTVDKATSQPVLTARGAPNKTDANLVAPPKVTVTARSKTPSKLSPMPSPKPSPKQVSKSATSPPVTAKKAASAMPSPSPAGMCTEVKGSYCRATQTLLDRALVKTCMLLVNSGCRPCIPHAGSMCKQRCLLNNRCSFVSTVNNTSGMVLCSLYVSCNGWVTRIDQGVPGAGMLLFCAVCSVLLFNLSCLLHTVCSRPNTSQPYG